jgi:predicted nucleic acid-binding protein
MARKSKPQVFLETSALVRFLVADDVKKSAQVSELLSRIEAGELRAVTSNIVWFELLYVLTTIYQFPRAKTAAAIAQLQSLRSLVTIEETDSAQALALWRSTKLPYGDCVIALQVPAGATLATFDRDFAKIDGLRLHNWQ